MKHLFIHSLIALILTLLPSVVWVGFFLLMYTDTIQNRQPTNSQNKHLSQNGLKNEILSLIHGPGLYDALFCSNKNHPHGAKSNSLGRGNHALKPSAHTREKIMSAGRPKTHTKAKVAVTARLHDVALHHPLVDVHEVTLLHPHQHRPHRPPA